MENMEDCALAQASAHLSLLRRDPKTSWAWSLSSEPSGDPFWDWRIPGYKGTPKKIKKDTHTGSQFLLREENLFQRCAALMKGNRKLSVSSYTAVFDTCFSKNISNNGNSSPCLVSKLNHLRCF